MNSRPTNAFKYCIRVSWGDCDPAKIVYTGRLTNFSLDAINAWWGDKFDGDGWYQMELDKNVGTPFVRFEMDFHQPVTPRETLYCFVWPLRLGNTSISFRVEGEQGGNLCFSARTVSVFTIADQFEKRAAPEEMRRVIEMYLPSD